MKFKQFVAAAIAGLILGTQPVSSVNAAELTVGALQGITETSSERQKVGAIAWQGSVEYARPGDVVQVRFTIYDHNNKNLAISGAEFTITPREGYDEDRNSFPPLEIDGFMGSAAYQSDIEYDPETKIYSFQNSEGKDVESIDGRTVISLRIIIPDDCEYGIYPIDLNILKVTGEGGRNLTFFVLDYDASVNVSRYPPDFGTDKEEMYGILGNNCGYYASNDEGSFNIEHLRSLKVAMYNGDYLDYESIKDYVVFMDNNGNIDPSPSSIYDARKNGKYDHDVMIGYYDGIGRAVPLTDEAGDPIYINAYIYDGTPGDVNDDDMISPIDYNELLAAYSHKLVGEEFTLSEAQVFFADVDSFSYKDGQNINNWKKSPEERKIDALDAALIMKYYYDYSKGGSQSTYEFFSDLVDKSFDGSGGFTDEQISNAPVRPKLSMKTSVNKAEKKVTVDLKLSGANEKYAAYGLLMSYDERLAPIANEHNKYVTLGDAVANMNCSYVVDTAAHKVSLTGAAANNDGRDGTICTMEFALPEDYREGNSYEFNLVNDGNEMFCNIENDEAGQLMQAYVLSELPMSAAAVVSDGEEIFYGDANNNGVITIDDAVLIMQALANPDKYGVGGTDESAMTPQGKLNADCYQPGSDITAMDALSVQRFLLNSITELPEN